jgi:hypothetical protein
MGNNFLLVPATPEGQAFFKQLRRYLNKEQFGLIRRGRGRPTDGSRRPPHGTPVGKASGWAIYLSDKERGIITADLPLLCQQQSHEISTLKSRVTTLEKEYDAKSRHAVGWHKMYYEELKKRKTLEFSNGYLEKDLETVRTCAKKSLTKNDQLRCYLRRAYLGMAGCFLAGASVVYLVMR